MGAVRNHRRFEKDVMKKFIPVALMFTAALLLLGCQSGGPRHSVGMMAMGDKKCDCCAKEKPAADTATKGKMCPMMTAQAGHDHGGSSTNAPSANASTNAPPHVHVH